MVIYRYRKAATMPKAYSPQPFASQTATSPGARLGWRSSGVTVAGVLPGHEGTLVPFAGAPLPRPAAKRAPGMRITSPVAVVRTNENDQFSTVPGCTWSPPV